VHSTRQKLSNRIVSDDKSTHDQRACEATAPPPGTTPTTTLESHRMRSILTTSSINTSHCIPWTAQETISISTSTSHRNIPRSHSTGSSLSLDKIKKLESKEDYREWEKTIQAFFVFTDLDDLNLPDGTAHDPPADLAPLSAGANAAAKTAHATAMEKRQKEQRA
jgi:hypothetical protein